jgi:hypothetical protein
MGRELANNSITDAMDNFGLTYKKGNARGISAFEARLSELDRRITELETAITNPL